MTEQSFDDRLITDHLNKEVRQTATNGLRYAKDSILPIFVKEQELQSIHW